MIDYITPAMRLAPHVETLEVKRARAWKYLNDRRISVLHHGFVPTTAVNTDVRATIVRATSERITQACTRYVDGLPVFLRRQAS